MPVTAERPSVLVTGAGGFVGAPLCGTLVARGWRVTAATRTGVVVTAGVTPIRLELLESEDAWRAALRGCDAVVHLAARVHELRAGAQFEAEYRRVNLEGTRFVAERALEAGVRRFVFLSSIKVNGEGGSRPYSESDPPAPQDAYGRSKWAAEQALKSICDASPMQLVVIRPPLVYGPGVRANFARLMRLARSGLPLPVAAIDNRRSFLGVSNLVDFIERCLLHDGARGHTWLVSDGEDLSTPQLLQRLARLMQRPLRTFRVPTRTLFWIARPLGLDPTLQRLASSLQVDSTSARTRLGWRPPLSVDEELGRTVAALREGRA